MRDVFSVKRLLRGGMIAAVYAVLTLVLAPIGYGQIQFRVSELLCILPLFLPEAVPGLFVGCFIANLFGSTLGVFDVIFGSLFSLMAAFLTWALRNKPLWIALTPPVLINALGIGSLLYFLAGEPYWISCLSIALGQTAAVFVIGLPLARLIRSRYAGSRFFEK